MAQTFMSCVNKAYNLMSTAEVELKKAIKLDKNSDIERKEDVKQILRKLQNILYEMEN